MYVRRKSFRDVNFKLPIYFPLLDYLLKVLSKSHLLVGEHDIRFRKLILILVLKLAGLPCHQFKTKKERPKRCSLMVDIQPKKATDLMFKCYISIQFRTIIRRMLNIILNLICCFLWLNIHHELSYIFAVSPSFCFM